MDVYASTVVQQGITWVALCLYEWRFSLFFFLLEAPFAEECIWHSRADEAFAFPAGKKGILKISHTVQAGRAGPHFAKWPLLLGISATMWFTNLTSLREQEEWGGKNTEQRLLHANHCCFSKRSVSLYLTLISISCLPHLLLPYWLFLVKENSKMHTVSNE